MDNDDLLKSAMDDDDLLSSTMDVIIFEPETGTEFTLGIGYFDSALEIKLKIQEYRNIPVSRQTLTFNGEILLDDNGVIDCMFFDNSRISLTIDPDQINLLLNLSTSSNMRYSSLQIDANAKLHQLKEKILLMDLGTSNLWIDRIVLQINGMELWVDEIRLCDYNIRNGTIIDVTVSSNSGSAAAAAVMNSSPRSSLQNPHMNLEDIFSAPPIPLSYQNLLDINDYEIVQDSPIIISQETEETHVTLEKPSPPTQSDQINLLIQIPTNNKHELSHDEKTLRDYVITHGEKIDVTIKPLLTSSGSGSATVINSSPSSSSKKRHAMNQIKLLINLPAENTQHSCIKIYVNDKIGQMKEKILAMDIGISRRLIKRLMLQCGTEVLWDDEKTLRGYHIKDRSKIDVIIKPSPRRKLRILVVRRNNCTTEKLEMEVNAMDNVGKLREKLRKRNYPLPPGDYFFVYDLMEMNDDKSWWWHQVCKGATIEIFKGNAFGRS